MEKSILNKKYSKSMNNLPLADMDESSELEKFHSETESRSCHVGMNRSWLSESSIEISIIFDSDTSKDSNWDVAIGASSERPAKLSGESGLCDITGTEKIKVLVQKCDKLSDLCIEVSELLAALKDDIQFSNQTVEQVVAEHGRTESDSINLAVARRMKSLQIEISEESAAAGRQAVEDVNFQAEALLEALEYKQNEASIDAVIRTSLTKFLQSDELKKHMVAATMVSIQQVIKDCLSVDFFSPCLAVLERSQRRLLIQQLFPTFDEVFRKMKANVLSFSSSSDKSTRTLRLALESHQRLLEDSAQPIGDIMRMLQITMQDVLQKELPRLRWIMLNELAELQLTSNETSSSTSSLKYMPSSPPQPAEPGRSAIDQLMDSVEINVQIKEGDVNGAFFKALMASELSLVMAACRAADPAVVFATPCKLEQHVLLSLLQQLSTDMVHDTQLKCRYMEEALMKLDIEHPVTRQHLPGVVEELCYHLLTFVSTFPGHMSGARIKVLIVAAAGLLQYIEDDDD